MGGERQMTGELEGRADLWIDDGQMDRWTDIIQSVTVFGVRHGR